MTDSQPIRIATISNNPDPHWAWIRDLISKDFTVGGRRLYWRVFSTAPGNTGAHMLGGIPGFARFRGARALANAARQEPFDVVVSHGPWTTAWTEAFFGKSKANARHLAFSFNFTDLPNGARKTLMTRAFRTVDAFAVFTDAEQAFYADYFNIDAKKILRAPWGVAPPLASPPPRQIEGEYFVALGGEARDYETLCATARLCPDLQFVAIARPHSFDRLSPPANLAVHINLPFEAAWGLVYHAAVALIPLLSRDTPCGLVTLVGAMHLGKAQIVTDAAGVSDYLANGQTGLLVPPKDPGALAAAVKRLQKDPALAARLGENAKTYASTQCNEAATIDFFENLLLRWFG